ncbi:hypothetical protein [Ethanoligenens harbinense]|uniref:hypothetical protein n=1 Tax=Ethanoligenens harbinense TaxID=253239 RepID=UPI0003253A16|nr:hypothetical protein [Ethanoligenens harbinense]
MEKHNGCSGAEWYTFSFRRFERFDHLDFLQLKKGDDLHDDGKRHRNQKRPYKTEGVDAFEIDGGIVFESLC